MMWNERLRSLISWLLGLPDRLFALVAILPSSPKFFSQGYGTPQIYFDRRNRVLAALRGGSYPHKLVPGETLHLNELHVRDGIVTIEGRFISPVEHELPEEARTCHFQLLEPTSSTMSRINKQGKKKNKVYVILFPATGEIGGGTRRALAKQLAQRHGYSFVILTAPYYGRRKPAEQTLFFLNTVSDILVQSQAIIEEGLLLTEWLLSREPEAMVCHSGFSFGAAMATCTTALSLVAGLPGRRIGCAPYVGSASPNVLADGVLVYGIDWMALQQQSTAPSSKGDSARKQLFDLLDETQLHTISGDTGSNQKSNTNRAAAIHCLNFYNDAVLRPVYTKQLHAQCKQLGPVQVDWSIGGHAVAALVRPFLQRRLIEETVNEMTTVRQQREFLSKKS